MPDIETTALIERLQQSNRRWKRLALSLLATLGLALVLLTMVLWVRAERQARQEEAAEDQARQQAVDEERLFRQLHEDANKRSQEALQALDKLQHQGRHP